MAVVLIYGPVAAPKSGPVAAPKSGPRRREACKIAGVEPTIRVLDGEDPTAYPPRPPKEWGFARIGRLALKVRISSTCAPRTLPSLILI